MEVSDRKNSDSAECVRVAVNIRPLITPELLLGCTDCISVVPGEPQIQIGSHAFTYDCVYGSTGSPLSAIYDECVAPLVDAFFNGYNATVLAYGQTGSGKTYTMGTNYNGEGSNDGIIPKVMENIYKRVNAMKDSAEFFIRVSFIEIFKEEVFDLLDPNFSVSVKGEVASTAKPYMPARVPIQIRETINGGITLSGVNEPEVRTKEELASYLARGSLLRSTGSTNMNSQSSRSHAILTITMELKKSGDDILCAKLHLVDLAGSERAKRTGADGMRLKEGIHINKGLLALGNVISALGDEKKRKEGGHVPYRDSKLTRLLQDSLGGNSKTVMIACVSPADTNAEETLNTLKYANRARNIQNKAVINRDPVAAQMQKMQSEIDQLKSELLFYRGDGSSLFEEHQILKQKISLLEASNAELQRELQERRISSEHFKQRALDAQVEQDKLIMKIESLRNGKPWDEIDSSSNQDYDLVKSYASKIQELEGELLQIKNSSRTKSNHFVDCIDAEEDGFGSKNVLFSCINEFSSDPDTKALDISDDIEVDEKELEHTSLQEKLDWEMKELDKRLEQKEAEMKRFASVDTSVLKQHYEKKIQELEQEKKFLQKEMEELRRNVSNISTTSGDGAQKLKEEYLQKLNVLEAQVSELKKKQDAQAQLLRQKQKSDEAAKRLQDEIQKIKTQKVQLQQKIKQESEQFRLWKATREKEVLQLKKEGRRNEYEMHKLLALNQRQRMVVQRKTEEAALATKRLKEFIESRRTPREAAGGIGAGIQALMQATEHELEIIVRVHEVRSQYDRQMEERARMANEITRLKEEARMMKQTNGGACPDMLSPGARNSRIHALENMLTTSSTSLVSMASQLSEAEERLRGFGGKGRWNQIRSLADAKNIMNYLFNLASSSRCLLRDKEVACREKDEEIREYKEKVVRLSCSLRQMETHNAELTHQVKLLNAAMKTGHKYGLRQLENRRSTIFLEDMDVSISGSEYSGMDSSSTDDEWVKPRKRVRQRKNGERSSNSEQNQSTPKDSEVLEESSREGAASFMEKTGTDICCNCSKSSSCKTNKCQCRAAGGICGSSCGCVPRKCANRGSLSAELSQQPKLEMTESNGSDSGTDEMGKSDDLVSQGALLLQSALADKTCEANGDGQPRSELVEANNDVQPRRKPLSDIGNKLAKPNASRPNQRKKWRKSTIVLVPSLQQENAAVAPNIQVQALNEAHLSLKLPQNMQETPTVSSMQPDNGMNEADIPLKIPRAMRKGGSNSNIPFADRNASSKPDGTLINKEASIVDPRSPVRQKRTLHEKENHHGS